MAIKGLSIPTFGTYSNSGGTISYSNPTVAEKAVEYGVSITSSDDNPLYGDNDIAEDDAGSFQTGELTLKTTDLTQATSILILGIQTKSVTFGPTGSTISASEGIRDDTITSPYLGFGVIEKHQIDNVDQYRGVFFPKVRFNIPEEAATTKGDAVDWQTPEITGKIHRSDLSDTDYKHPWMIDAWFDSESEAQEWLLWKCGKTYSVPPEPGTE